MKPFALQEDEAFFANQGTLTGCPLDEFFGSVRTLAAQRPGIEYELHGFHDAEYEVDEIILRCRKTGSDNWSCDQPPWNGYVMIAHVTSGCETDDEVSAALQVLNADAGSPFKIATNRVYRGNEGLADAVAVDQEMHV